MARNEELVRAGRMFARHVASQLIAAMSATDTSLAQIAVKLGCTEKKLRGQLEALIDGEPDGLTVRDLGEWCWAMDCAPVISICPIEEPPIHHSEAQNARAG